MKEYQKWWHPNNNKDDECLDWLCDHLGDAYTKMKIMWEKLCEYDPTLPKKGWDFEED